MKIPLFVAMLSITSSVAGQSNGQPKDPKVIIRTIEHLDSLFWESYNACDVDKMAGFFTDDMEFYHDKGGLTTPKSSFVTSLTTGFCANPDRRLRREQIEGTVKVFPMDNIGGLITGEHIFYINETGKKEYLDGYGKFMQLWLYDKGEWRMSRILSYDHGPAPYVNRRKEVQLSATLLKAYVGQYQSPTAGFVTITTADNSLTLTSEGFTVTMLPETETLFFVKERDLEFEFVRDKGKVTKLIVIEKGNKVDEAVRK